VRTPRASTTRLQPARRRPRALAVLILALGAGLVTAPRATAQEEEDLTAGVKTIRAAFDRARARIDELDFAGAIRELNGIIDPRRSARPSDMGTEESGLLCAALDMRARAYFNLGNPKMAEADFTALLRINPAYPIDRQTLSPKVVDLFDRVRARIAGTLVLQVDPPQARVTVDGDAVASADRAHASLLTGTRQLRIEAAGYDTYTETLTIAAGMEVRKAIRLVPNRRSLELITVPAGVSVSVDGVAAGVTRGPAPPEVEAMAARYNFDPRNASGPLLVPLLTPGEHKVTFERECSMPQTLTLKVILDPEHNVPLRFEPVVLQEAKSELRISSTPSGADVLIDGEKKGTTPVTIPGLCGGERDVMVTRPEVGSWSERIRVVPAQTNALDVKLRPTLLYAGTFRLDEWGRAVWSDADKPLLDEMAKGLKTLNVVRSPEILQEVRKSILNWMISDPNEVRGGTIIPPDVLEEIAGKARADLVLAGLTLNNDSDKGWTLALYSAAHAQPDLVPLRLDRPEGARDLVRRLDAAPPASEPWWGFTIADSLIDDAPIVVRVLAGSPAAKAGLRVGDRIKAVGNRKTSTSRDALQAINAEMTRPGGLKAAVVLALEDSSGARTARVAPGESPVVIPLTDPALLYNRALAEFRLRARAASDDLEKGVALLNLGVALMHFRAYDKAMSEGFLRASLPKGPGISDGTVLYYRALCALRRGDPSAARASFEAAATAAGSTYDSGDGPSAAAAAARMLLALQ
jgi:PEGA domain-containing protein/PDZ domain-containing protein